MLAALVEVGGDGRFTGADTGDNEAIGAEAGGGALCVVCAALVALREVESPPQDANVTHSANKAPAIPRLICMLSASGCRAEAFTLTSE